MLTFFAVIEGLPLLLNLHKLTREKKAKWKLINSPRRRHHIDINYLMLYTSMVVSLSMKSVRRLAAYPNVFHRLLFAHYFSRYSLVNCYFCMVMERLIVHHETQRNWAMDALWKLLTFFCSQSYFYSITSVVWLFHFSTDSIFILLQEVQNNFIKSPANKHAPYERKKWQRNEKLCLISRDPCNWMTVGTAQKVNLFLGEIITENSCYSGWLCVYTDCDFPWWK